MTVGLNPRAKQQHPGPTRVLAGFVAGSSYDDFPAPVMEKAKLCVLDSLACLMGGATFEEGKTVVDLATEIGGRPESTLIPSGLKVGVLPAAYANSYLANFMDFDDTSYGHPGAMIVPPALALAERFGSSGRELLHAIVMAYEVQARVSRAILASPERQDRVRIVSAHQIFGTVTAASILLRFNAQTTAMAFGLAGVNAPVPSSPTSHTERPLTWSKFNFGWASMGGILAALLASSGVVGDQTILDGQNGFWVMASSDRCNFEELSAGLGEVYRTMDVEFKPYPCCRYLHPSIDAAIQIVSENHLSPDSIQRVHVRSFSRPATAGMSADYAPAHAVDAEFSIPYVISQAVLGEPSGLRWLSEASLHSPQVLEMAKKVSFEVDPEAEKEYHEKGRYRSTVTVLAGGKEFTRRVDHPRSLSGTEIKEKFRDLSIPWLGDSRAGQAIKMIEDLEDCDNVSRLLPLLTARGNGGRMLRKNHVTSQRRPSSRFAGTT